MAEWSYPEAWSTPERSEYRRDVITAYKGELRQRQESALKAPGDRVWEMVERTQFQKAVYAIHPKTGFHVRTFRMFINNLPPYGEDVQRASGPVAGSRYGHRHTLEAVIYILRGKGFSVINGVRYDWQEGDFICVPVWAWHRHVNLTGEYALYLACVSAPFHEAIGLSIFEDELYPEEWVFAEKGDATLNSLIPGVAEGAPPPEVGDATNSERVYRQELRYAHEEEKRRSAAPVFTRGSDLVFEDTSQGRVAFVADPSIGFNTKIMSSYVLELPPGGSSPVHRHSYEEIGHVLAGTGVSVIGDDKVDWQPRDSLFVPPMEWHHHENTGDLAARILIHTDRLLMENIGMGLTQHHPAERNG